MQRRGFDENTVVGGDSGRIGGHHPPPRHRNIVLVYVGEYLAACFVVARALLMSLQVKDLTRDGGSLLFHSLCIMELAWGPPQDVMTITMNSWCYSYDLYILSIKDVSDEVNIRVMGIWLLKIREMVGIGD